MREVTSNYLAQVKSCARQFGFYVEVYGNSAEPDVLLLSDIISIDITRSASDQFQIGACMSAKLTLQTRATTLLNGRGKKVVVYYRCTAPLLGWDKLGTFYVDECVTERGVTAVIAYDKISKFDKRTTWTDATAPTFPCTMQALLNYLCSRAGVTTDFTCQDIIVDRVPDGYTVRELISYIAASHGGNAFLSANEILKIRPYTKVSEVIEYGGCYSMDVASDSGYTVKGILFDRGGDDKIYIDGTSSEYDESADGVVQAFNPFATVGIAEYAWSKLGGLNYSAVSIEMPAVNILEPGDVFTIQTADGTEKTAIVMEQTLSVSCTGGFVEFISCTAESKNQTRNAENRAEATEKAVQNSSSPLTSYEFLTDLSVKFNGVTYTAEKDGATGLISKVSDDAGNEFEPVINSGITDVAMHNAVLWAVAMMSGLNTSTIMPATEGLVGYFDYKRQCTAALWTNRLGGENIPITGSATVSNDCLIMPDGTHGTFSMPYTDGVMTLYAVLKCSNKTGTGSWNLNYLLGTGPMGKDGKARCLCEHFETWFFINSGALYDIDTEISVMDNYHIIAVTCDANQNEVMYIDGAEVGTRVVPKIAYGDIWGLNHLNNDGAVQEPSHLTSHFKMVAFGRTAHTAEQISANTAWLKKYYGI